METRKGRKRSKKGSLTTGWGKGPSRNARILFLLGRARRALSNQRGIALEGELGCLLAMRCQQQLRASRLACMGLERSVGRRLG